PPAPPPPAPPAPPAGRAHGRPGAPTPTDNVAPGNTGTVAVSAAPPPPRAPPPVSPPQMRQAPPAPPSTTTATLSTPDGTMNEYWPGEVNAVVFVAAARAPPAVTQPSARQASAEHTIRPGRGRTNLRTSGLICRQRSAGGPGAQPRPSADLPHRSTTYPPPRQMMS